MPIVLFKALLCAHYTDITMLFVIYSE